MSATITTTYYEAARGGPPPSPPRLGWILAAAAALLGAGLAVAAASGCDAHAPPPEFRWDHAGPPDLADRCPAPAPCSPSGDGFCADVVALCVDLGLPEVKFCEGVIAPWCAGGESACALCNHVKDRALIEGLDVDAAALLRECACLGVMAEDEQVCAR